MNISYEYSWVASGESISFEAVNDRCYILYLCKDWCRRKGYRFIQADFELEVFYYEEN